MRLELFSGRDDRASVERGPEGLILRLAGAADAEFLSRALESVHQETLVRHMKEITLDLTGLDPLDSSGVKALIKWAMLQAELDDPERYRIRLRYSEGVPWQKVSFAAISHLCRYVELDPTA